MYFHQRAPKSAHDALVRSQTQYLAMFSPPKSLPNQPSAIHVTYRLRQARLATSGEHITLAMILQSIASVLMLD